MSKITIGAISEIFKTRKLLALSACLIAFAAAAVFITAAMRDSGEEVIFGDGLIMFNPDVHTLFEDPYWNLMVSEIISDSFEAWDTGSRGSDLTVVFIGEVAGPSINMIIPQGADSHVVTPIKVHYIIHQGERVTNLRVGELVDIREAYFFVTPEMSYRYGAPMGTVASVRGGRPMIAGNRYLIYAWLSGGTAEIYNGERILSSFRRISNYRLSPMLPLSEIESPSVPHYAAFWQDAMTLYGHLYHTLPQSPPPAPLPQPLSPNEISITTQGFRETDIHDSSGNLLIREGRNIYRVYNYNPNTGSFTSRTQVGQRIPISQAMRRFNYVLDLDEYTFTNMIFTQGIETQITITTSYDWMLDSLVRYEGFAGSNHLELRVSPAVANLSNTLTRTVIEPSEIASPAELRRINEGR